MDRVAELLDDLLISLLLGEREHSLSFFVAHEWVCNRVHQELTQPFLIVFPDSQVKGGFLGLWPLFVWADARVSDEQVQACLKLG